MIRAAFGIAEPGCALNRNYRELARHYGFKVDPTPPAAPKKKGKVESCVKYVKNNALRGRDGESIDDVNAALERWVLEIAGTRVHGTTSKQPLSVYFEDERQATHRREGKTPWSTDEAHLPEMRAALRHRSRGYWEERADRLGEEVGQLVRDLFDSDDVLSQLRQVQAIVTHLEKFPVERARAACRRANHYGSASYQAIKNILVKALDREPLPTPMIQQALWADEPRFARSASTWTRSEVNHERH